VFENRVLRRIFGPNREEAVGGLRLLQNENLRNLYASSYIVRVMHKMGGGHAAHVGELGNAYRNLIGQYEGT
jgi:hypothetical protein